MMKSTAPGAPGAGMTIVNQFSPNETGVTASPFTRMLVIVPKLPLVTLTVVPPTRGPESGAIVILL